MTMGLIIGISDHRCRAISPLAYSAALIFTATGALLSLIWSLPPVAGAAGRRLRAEIAERLSF